jgi:hypothetical protein
MANLGTTVVQTADCTADLTTLGSQFFTQWMVSLQSIFTAVVRWG